MKKKSIIIIVVCVLAAVGAAAWFFIKPSVKGKVSLETGKVTLIDIKNSITATGTVEPVTEVTVGTQVSGIINKLYVDYNDEVKAGQVIAEMDRITLEAELQSAQSELANTQTEYEYRLKVYNRAKTLHDQGLISESEFDDAEYYYKKAKNSYEQSKASIVKVKRNLSYATITSPIDGVVISRAVEEGQTVAAGFETPTLFKIAKDLTKMQIIADVDEADIGQVVKGQRVEFTVDAYPDDIFTGVVDQVRLEATTESNVVTYEVVIKAENTELKLKPGLTANVEIFTLENRDVLSVPTKALRFTPEASLLTELGITIEGSAPEGKHVWVLRGQTISPIEVSVGSASGDRTEASGIDLGATVVCGLSVEAREEKSQNAERSPFMPTPPGGNKESKK